MGGCFSSGSESGEGGSSRFDAPVPGKERPTKHYAKPKWKADPPVTQAELQKQREEFWDTMPHYGGDRIIWDTLKAVVEADADTAKTLIEAAGIVVAAADMTVMYDERGAKYELPKFVLSDPVNLVQPQS